MGMQIFWTGVLMLAIGFGIPFLCVLIGTNKEPFALKAFSVSCLLLSAPTMIIGAIVAIWS